MLGQFSLTTSVLPPRGFVTAWDRPGRRGRGTGCTPSAGCAADAAALSCARVPAFALVALCPGEKSVKEKEKNEKNPNYYFKIK